MQNYKTHNVPQVENDWVNQFLDFSVDILPFVNNNWNLNYGPPVWFRYGLDPISWPIRANDLKPNYVPCSSIPLRAMLDEKEKLTNKMELQQQINAYPNPFINEVISVTISEQAWSDLKNIQITDITGRNVTALFKIRNIDETGFQIKPVDTDQLAPGLYLCSFGNKNSINRIKLLKR